MTPTSSVLAFQVRLICEVEVGVAVKPVGVDGGVVSGVPGSALNATMCMTHALPFWFAVALYGPTAVTFLSSVRLPNVVERDVKPVPA